MATTQNSYTGDGTTVLYSFTFPYLEESHVKVTLDEVVTTAYTFANATQIQFNTAPASSVRIRIYRETNVDTAEATFFAGSSIRHTDLNDNQLQALYAAQEQENNKWGKNVDTIVSTETWSSSDTKIATTASVQNQVATQVAGIINSDVVAGNAITVTPNTPTAGKVTVAVTNNSIDTAELVDASVTTAKIADNNVTSDKILNGNVTTAKIADANVTEAKLATDSVTSAKIAAGAVDTSELATDAVTSVKIADANVTTAKIANSAVNSDKLANDSVIATKILNNTITTDKLTDATVVTDAEQATVVTNDTSFFTTTAADSRFVNTTGDTMSGALNMGTNKITNLGTPTATTDATTKAYVDGVVASGTIADADYGDITVSGSGTTWTIDNNTITSAKIVNGTIVDGDINASAAIAGTKVSPDFGSQDVQTSGLIKTANGTAVNPSITFTSDTNTGVYRSGVDEVGITTGGVRRGLFDGNGLRVDGQNVTISDQYPAVILDGNADDGVSGVILRDNAGNGSGLSFIHTNYVGGTDLNVGGDGTVLSGQANIGINAGASSDIRFGVNDVETARIDSNGQLRVVGSGTAAAPAVIVGNDLNTGIYSPGADQVAVATNGTGRLFVDASGNVGVGAAPTTRLEVARLGATWTGAAAVAGTALFLHNGNNSSTSPTNIQISAGNAAASRIYLSDSDNATKGIIEYDHADDHLHLSTNGSERLRITSAGLVGIGTSTPSKDLHIQPSADNGGILIKGSFANRFTAYTSPDTGAGYRFGYSESVGGLIQRCDADGAFVANTMVFDSSGNVGIGTTSPGDVLHVMESSASAAAASGASVAQFERAGNAAITISTADTGESSLFFGDTASSTVGRVQYDHSDNSLGLWANSSERARIDSIGRLGIGTSAPAYPVHVSNNAATFDRVLQLSSANTTTLIGFGTSGGSGELAPEIGASGTGLQFNTQNTPRMTIIAAGKVGIGTTSPARPLVVDGGSDNIVAAFQSTGTGCGIGFKDGTTTADNVVTLRAIGNNLVAHAGSSERLRIDSSGNVGIGTTSPGFTLDVNGNPGFGTTGGVNKCFIKRASDGTANSYIGYLSTNSTDFAVKNGSGAGDVILEGNAGNIRFNTASSTERARIDSSGRLLVGASSTSGSALVQIQGYSGVATGAGLLDLKKGSTTPADGDALGALYFSDSGSNRGAQITGIRDGGTWTPGSSHPGRLAFSTTADGASSPTERMRISSDGRVGINGSANSFQNFAVNGTITQTDGNVTEVISVRGQVNAASNTIIIFQSRPALNASVSAANYNHYIANPGSFNAATVVNQYGFNADGNLTGATNNFGFFSNIASGANRWNFYANGTAANRFNGNVLIGGTQQPTSATLALCLSNGTAPTASISNGVILYAEDVSASSELKVRDEAGNVTTLSPHNFDLIPEGPSEEMAWSYYSERDGKRINVDMLKAIRLLEQISGEKLVYSS